MKKTVFFDEDRIFSKLSKNAKKVIVSSYELAKVDRQNYRQQIMPKHLFAAILQEHSNLAARLLEKLNVDLLKTVEAIMGTEIANSTVSASVVPSQEYREIIAEAYLESTMLGHVYVGCEHLLLALLKHDKLPFIVDLKKSGLDYERIMAELLNFATYQSGVFSKAGTGNIDNAMPMNGDAPSTAALDYFGRNMNKLAKEGRYLPVTGRETEINRLIHILSRQTKNNPILVGEAGVGKTAVVEGLVQQIAAGDVPASFANIEIIQIDIASIIAGAKIRGDVEERLLAIMNEVEKSTNKIIFIDEIHTIVGSGGTGGGNDIANVLKPYLTNPDLRVIGATTPDEYRKYFEEDSALARRFQPVMVDELNVEASIKVLKHLRNNFEQFHQVAITDEAIADAVKLSKRYVSDRYLPDKAIDLIDEAAAHKKIEKNSRDTTDTTLEDDLATTTGNKESAISAGDWDAASKYRLREIDISDQIKNKTEKKPKISKRFKVESDDIKTIISAWTKIPVSSLSSFDFKNISQIHNIISEKIIGQEDAVNKIASTLKRVKLGFGDANRPLASFLFLGPTGVGKTETAKVIAREIFGSEDALIQLNMSEFMESHSVAKIIGAPPGYVGYQDGNNITESVRKNPHSVVLFDEIEKAHPDTLNVLLQIMDEGYLQDSKGRKVNFKNTIVIMTSNIGAEQIAEDKVLGFDVDFDHNSVEKRDDAYETMRDGVIEELKNYLKPEFINRIDEIIVYRGLNQEDVELIVEKLLQELNLRLSEKFLGISYNKEIVRKIAKEGFSKEYGARNIKRKIQELLENKLADFILDQNLYTELAKRQKKKLPELEVVTKLGKNNFQFELKK